MHTDIADIAEVGKCGIKLQLPEIHMLSLCCSGGLPDCCKGLLHYSAAGHVTTKCAGHSRYRISPVAGSVFAQMLTLAALVRGRGLVII